MRCGVLRYTWGTELQGGYALCGTELRNGGTLSYGMRGAGMQGVSPRGIPLRMATLANQVQTPPQKALRNQTQSPAADTRCMAMEGV